jgi:TniQ
MNGITQSLWPIRYKPLPDELLSSWLVRLAHGHGIKVQTFCNLIFGNKRQVWNRDIDRLAPSWLIAELAERTGTPFKTAQSTTLRAYEGLLYPRFKPTGTLTWIQTLKMYHRKREGHGMQFCSQCLREDAEPYFRKSWRIAFNTYCSKHGCMLRDRCPSCQSAVVFHRMDVGNARIFADQSLVACHACQFDLCKAPIEPVVWHHADAQVWLQKVEAFMGTGFRASRRRKALEKLRVMRQMTTLLTSRYASLRLREWVCEQIDAPYLPLTQGHVSIESRPLAERHHLVQLAAWLMTDLKPRLRQAWRSKAVRYNHMLKDFEDPPAEYVNIARNFSNWRRANFRSN